MSVVCLLLTQCRKPVFPNMGEERTISFTTNSGDSKGDLEHNGSSFIYKWNTTDKVYVYASVSGSFGASNSQFCGVLDFDTDKYSSSEPTKGYFKGNVKMPEGMTGASKLRFFHFGSGVNPTITGNDGNQTCTANVDFAAQNGLLTGDGSVSSKIIAMSRDVAYSEDGSYSGDDCKLVAQFAVGVFTLDKFAGNVTVKKETGVNYTGLSVDQYGVLTQTSGTSMVVDYRMGNSYIAFVPDPAASKTSATYTFETAARISKVTMDVLAGKFLSLGSTGASVELKPLIKGSLPGKFTVNSEGKQVQFSKGNLYCIKGATDADNQWYFENNQYDYRTIKCDNGTRVLNGVYDKGTEANNWGVFGQSTDGTGCNWGMYTGSSDITGNFVDWGNNAISNGGNTPDLWRTLTKDEWSYILFTRTSGTVGTTSNARYAKIRIYVRDDVQNNNHFNRGLLLFPDSFTWNATDMGTCPTNINIADSKFLGPDGTDGTTYTINQFEKMEEAGAIFLPAVGRRIGSSMNFYHPNQNLMVGYWSSTGKYYMISQYSSTNSDRRTALIESDYYRYGYSVRLVRDVESDGNGSASPFSSGEWGN